MLGKNIKQCDKRYLAFRGTFAGIVREVLGKKVMFKLKSKCQDEAYRVNWVVEHSRESSIHYYEMPATNSCSLKYVENWL